MADNPSPTDRALTTVDIAERLTVHAYAALERGDVGEAQRLLAALVEETKTLRESLVKDPKRHARIARAAAARTAAVGVWRHPVIA